jgi:hypothetical protein
MMTMPGVISTASSRHGMKKHLPTSIPNLPSSLVA